MKRKSIHKLLDNLEQMLTMCASRNLRQENKELRKYFPLSIIK